MEPGGIRSVVSECLAFRKPNMEKSMLTSPTTITASDGPPPCGSDREFRQECRNMIRILSFTIDSLCENNFENDRKLQDIRTLIATLSTMRALAEDVELRFSGLSTPGYFADINGERYVAVNTCELERFSAK